MHHIILTDLITIMIDFLIRLLISTLLVVVVLPITFIAFVCGWVYIICAFLIVGKIKIKDFL